MSSNKQNHSPAELVREVRDAKAQLEQSIQGFKSSVNPVNQAKALASKPTFLIALGLAGIGLLAAVFWKISRTRKKNHWMRNLPDRMQDYFAQGREQITEVRDKLGKQTDLVPSRKKRLAKSIAQVAWKAATPVLISVLRRQFVPAREVPK